MGTRSTIALEYADGTVEQVYCHWDGYLSHNGQILHKHYSDPFKLRDLIDLGDMSSLGERLGTQHAFDKAPEGECTFYLRDRKEQGCKAKQFKDYADYIENHQYEEYEYILRKDGNWYVKQHDNEFELLAPALVKALAEETA
jgi:hypothetical protein